MKWPHRSNDRYLVVGLTQSGKTNLTRALFDEFAGVQGLTRLVIDPKNDDQLEAWFGPPAGPPPWDRGGLIRYVPEGVTPKENEAEIDRILIWAYHARNVLIWLDELPPPDHLPDAPPGIHRRAVAPVRLRHVAGDRAGGLSLAPGHPANLPLLLPGHQGAAWRQLLTLWPAGAADPLQAYTCEVMQSAEGVH